MPKTLKTSCRLMTKVYFSVLFSIHEIVHCPFAISGRNPKFFQVKIKQNIFRVIAYAAAAVFVTLY